ncbi:FAM86A protein [Plectosphaerella plurivora]|uniref:FAM86A protein n=1 Tax=Plectosphaerella plurivora TaxID=936078 RepID=A0A9P8VMS8_9PEZI|nr:FAM86A protein [Plectosphaerella plurivora]
MDEASGSGRGSAALRFCHQVLQLEQELDYPPPEDLREAETQSLLYRRLFSEADDGPCYAPPTRYSVRVLKELIRRIESSIEDWDTHEVSEDLMGRMAELLATPMPSEFDSAQQKSYVTYHLSRIQRDGAPETEAAITLLESRSLISASGTTGLRTWEAALHLGEYLCSNPHIVRGRNVLELGAGTGYLAILCGKFLGAQRVVASDGSDDVINNLPESLFLNGLQDADRAITPMELRWGHALVGTEDREWNGGEAVDVVLGADITYDERILPALVGTLEELMGMFPGLEVLISATQRNEATFESFQARCRMAGLGLEEVGFGVPVRAAQKGPFYSDAVPIRICSVRRGETR